MNSFRAERPGGLALTRRMIELSGLKPGARLLDAGCGEGASVEFLLNKGYRTQGVDLKIYSGTDTSLPLHCGRIHDLPFASSEFEAVLCECVFSLLHFHTDALCEFKRVLKKNGILMMSDIYARVQAENKKRERSWLFTCQDITALLGTAGFEMEFFEDHSDVLAAAYCQMVMDIGAERVLDELDFHKNKNENEKIGYYLLIAGMK